MKAGWIYGLEGRGGTLKIGRTGRTPTERCGEVQVAPRYRAHGPFRLAWSVAVPDMERAEQTIHRMLRDQRVFGELFRVTPDVGREVALAIAIASRKRGRRIPWRLQIRSVAPRGFFWRLLATGVAVGFAASLLAP